MYNSYIKCYKMSYFNLKHKIQKKYLIVYVVFNLLIVFNMPDIIF